MTAKMDEARDLLLRAASTHGIQVRNDELMNALQDTEHGNIFASWATQHLQPDTLLSAEELALYSALDKSGQVDKLASLHDLAEIQAIPDSDIRTAITQLNASTAAVTKQTHILRQQQDALSRLIKKTSDGTSRRKELEATRLRSAESEKRRLAREVEDAAQSLHFRALDLEQQAESPEKGVDRVVEDILVGDDQLLKSLQKLGWELEQGDPEEASMIEHLRELCMRSIKTQVETIRTRLDTVFLNTLEGISSDPDRVRDLNPSQEEIGALGEELESLYSEILPVAQMSAERDHLEPALRSISARSGQSMTQSVGAVQYISECLDYLLDRMGRLQSHVETHKSHQAASTAILSTLKAEVASAKSSPTPPVAAQNASPASPVRKQPTSRNRTTRTTTSRRSSDLPDAPALENLFQSLALPSRDPSLSVREQISSLSRDLVERSRKSAYIARNAQDSFEASATAHLDDVRCAVQLLRDTVLAETPFGDVQLVDGEIEGSIQVLEGEVERAKDMLKEAEGDVGDGKSEKREEILSRWAP